MKKLGSVFTRKNNLLTNTSGMRRARRKITQSLFIMTLPACIWLLLFRYLPMPGLVLAFKDYKITRGLGFIENVIVSPWNNLANFRAFFVGSATGTIIRNTLLFNITFIIVGVLAAILIALCLNELRVRHRKSASLYQTLMLLPFFLSWVVVSYLLFALLSPSDGIANQIIRNFGGEGIRWYSEPGYWPFILVFITIWKSAGYNSIIYLAAMTGIDDTLYDSAIVDGATKLQQIRHITLPLIAPIVWVLVLLSFGSIFFADFGLFYQVTRNTGALYPTTNVIDTYVFRALIVRGDIGLSASVGLLQSLIGFILVVSANIAVRKIDPEKSLF